MGEERRLRGRENRVLRRIFGPKRGEVIWEWRKLHNDELNDTHFSTAEQILFERSNREEFKWAENATRMGEWRSTHGFIVGKPEGKRPLGRPRRRWEYNIMMELQKVCWGTRTGLIWLKIEAEGGNL